MTISAQQFQSLNEALSAMKIPLENHAMIRKLTTFIGIRHYARTGSYIKAVRISGGPTLNIHYGWTSGFESREEAELASHGLARVWPSNRGQGQWGVDHPVHRMHASPSTQKPANEGRQSTCPTCNTVKSVTGSCLCD